MVLHPSASCLLRTGDAPDEGLPSRPPHRLAAAAPFVWAVGQPVAAEPPDTAEWLAFLASDVATGDEWTEFLRGQ